MVKIYTILVNDSNELVASVRERIICRNKLVDKLHFLVSPTYKDMNMSDFTVTMEYVLPVSKEYHTEILKLQPDKFTYLVGEFLEYRVPFDTSLTKEPGNVSVQLIFTKTAMDEDGKITQYVRHTTSTSIAITPLTAWSDMVPDAALTALDQRLLKTDAMINELTDIATVLDDTKADNLILNNSTLQLTSNSNPIGNAVDISKAGSGSGGTDGEKIKVVEF